MQIRPVLPWFITSTDDTTLFAFEGIATGEKVLCLVDKKNDDSTRSNFSQDADGTNNKCGKRVRHTFTLNAAGNVADIYVVVYGLTDKDKLQEERALVEKEMEARLAIYKIVDEADEIL